MQNRKYTCGRCKAVSRRTRGRVRRTGENKHVPESSVSEQRRERDRRRTGAQNGFSSSSSASAVFGVDGDAWAKSCGIGLARPLRVRSADPNIAEEGRHRLCKVLLLGSVQLLRARGQHAVRRRHEARVPVWARRSSTCRRAEGRRGVRRLGHALGEERLRAHRGGRRARLRLARVAHRLDGRHAGRGRGRHGGSGWRAAGRRRRRGGRETGDSAGARPVVRRQSAYKGRGLTRFE
jgi:hypothetical protein